MTKLRLLDRLRLKKRKGHGATVGVVWYDRESWARVKETATDPERFEATFDEWLVMAEDTLRDFVKGGCYPAKVEIDPDELFAWCKARDTLNDAGARARFVSYKLRLADDERV